MEAQSSEARSQSDHRHIISRNFDKEFLETARLPSNQALQ